MAERGTAMGAVVFLFQSQSQFSHRVNEDFLRVEDRTVWLRPTHRNTVCVCACLCFWLSCQWSPARLVVLTCTVRGQGWDYCRRLCVNELALLL